MEPFDFELLKIHNDPNAETSGLYKYNYVYDIVSKKVDTIAKFVDGDRIIYSPVLTEDGKKLLARCDINEGRGYTRQLSIITFDNGVVLRVGTMTEFKLEDGTFKIAKELTPEDKLFYTEFSNKPKGKTCKIVSVETKHFNEIYLDRIDSPDGDSLIPLIKENEEVNDVRDLVYICIKE